MLVIQDKESRLLLITSIVLGLSAAFYLYYINKYSLVYYGDSISHLVIARRIIDSINPGLSRLGTVWLPLPHLLLLPFSVINPLFKTGFAGLVVSLPSLAITSVFLYKIIARMQSGFSYIALACAFLYVSNPNILFLGLTAMTESPFMLFFVISAYYLQEWLVVRQNLDCKYNRSSSCAILLKFSFFLCLASLCRYEVWILPIFAVTVIILIIMRRAKDGSKPQLQHQQKTAIIITILISFISFSGIAIWFIWNMYEYGDPWKFADAQYTSAAWQALNRPYRQTLFLQPLNVAITYGVTAVAMYGPVLVIVAIVEGIIIAMSHRHLKGQSNSVAGKKRERTMMSYYYVYLGLPPICTVVFLLIGIGEMRYWFNSRFLILLSPLLLIVVSMLIRRWIEIIKKKFTNRTNQLLAITGTISILFAYNFIIAIFPAPFGVVTFLDAKRGFFSKVTNSAVLAGEALGLMYRGNGIIMMITGSGQEHKIMLTSGISLRQFDDIRDSGISKNSFREPWLYYKWIVVSKQPDPGATAAAKYWLHRENLLAEYFHLTYQNKYYQIMARK